MFVNACPWSRRLGIVLASLVATSSFASAATCEKPVAGVAFTFHPGDAAGALTALAKAHRITLRSDGAGVDSGAVDINLPTEALKWLTDCGRSFNIAIDRPTDPTRPTSDAAAALACHR